MKRAHLKLGHTGSLRFGRGLKILLGAGVLFGGQVLAGAPVAIIEDVDAPDSGVAFMDYLEAGQMVRLGERGRLTIGYLRSCLRELVSGGTVTIGKEQSVVSGGRVTRERVECDGGNLRLTVDQAGKSTVMVLRKAPTGSAIPQAAFTIYGTSPIIISSNVDQDITIERLDRPEDPLTFAARMKFVDLSEKGVSLTPGGLYRARNGDRNVTFRVGPYAASGPGPVIGRLVSF